MNIMIFIILFMTALSCAGIGSFLMLRSLSMLTDAISHSVLLGIVLAYFITKDIESPILILGAAVFGLITVYAIESLSNTGLVKKRRCSWYSLSTFLCPCSNFNYKICKKCPPRY